MIIGTIMVAGMVMAVGMITMAGVSMAVIGMADMAIIIRIGEAL